MNDTVKRIMGMVDEYMIKERNGTNGHEARQALEDELTRLFTPLSDEQVRRLCKVTWVFDTAKQWVQIVEQAHGITGESK